MTRTASYENPIWSSTVYTPLVEWQKVLSKLTKREVYKGLFFELIYFKYFIPILIFHRLLSKSDQQSSSIKRSERLVLPKNHLIDNSFVSPSPISLSTNMAHSSIDISRQSM